MLNISTSKGNQSKYLDADRNLWCKVDYLGYEALSEAIVSELLEGSNVDFIKYAVETFIDEYGRKQPLSISENFKPEGFQIITLARFIERATEARIREFYKNLSSEQMLYNTIELVHRNTNINDYHIHLGRMLELDAFTLNEDRHLNNILLLYDVNSNKYYPSPIFDNGAALLSDLNAYPLYISIKALKGSVKAKPFSNSFFKQLEAVKEVCGLTLKLRDNEVDARNYEQYSIEIQRRVNNLIVMQKQKYNYLFL